jgi:hypothetical protein
MGVARRLLGHGLPTVFLVLTWPTRRLPRIPSWLARLNAPSWPRWPGELEMLLDGTDPLRGDTAEP